MFESLCGAESEVLKREDYLSDFYRTFEGNIERFDKLERGQSFQEPGYESWEAFHRGDWRESLSLLESSRPALVDYYDGMRRRGLTTRRVRVVESPVTPYIQWEMHVLRLRAELGEEIRIVDAGGLREFEKESPVPELVILGYSTLYEILYNATGIGAGARRFRNRDLIDEVAAAFESLYRQGEEFFEFFDHTISPLAPPT
ncbi:DUF6879 family protein [Streptomyces sp. H27-D2]|uniref:DUF6879 family protein n=1 Tax=Streptomyces sp. H27-D2 TaxID=3046304 RepID=UPI002DB9094E|nr:DUF6879 family protein [Streptomyces sp. H27-D2]MEC4016257.1 hypothetical protein [Streptomyces sp. H27-D2]